MSLMIKLASDQTITLRLVDGQLNDGTQDFANPGNEQEADIARFAALLEEAQAGDESALGDLLSHYRDYLTAIANRQLESAIRPKVAASDLVQQSMMAIQGNIENFRGQTPGEFRAWIRQILSNDVRDAQRKYRGAQQRTIAREHRLDDSQLAHPPIRDEQMTPATDARAKEEASVLRKAMSRLPDNYQQVIQMRNWDELDFESIGSQLDCSADAARKLWFRAVQRLKAELGTFEESP